MTLYYQKSLHLRIEQQQGKKPAISEHCVRRWMTFRPDAGYQVLASISASAWLHDAYQYRVLTISGMQKHFINSRSLFTFV